MRAAALSLLLALLCSFQVVNAQTEGAHLPPVTIKNLNGQPVSTEAIEIEGPTVVSFWATWCKPCISELIAVHEHYQDLQDEVPGFKLIAISIDDARNTPKVRSFVNGRAWDYEVYIDENSDLKRAMNVNNVPHTFLLNASGEVVWQHTSYVSGDEYELMDKVREVAEAGTPE